MHEFIHISFSPRIEKFEEYFQEWDKLRYGGELQEGIDSGKFIFLEKKRILIGKQRLDTYNKWLDSFDELINMHGLIAGNRPEELNPFFESGKTYHAFNNLSKIDPNDKYGFGLFSFFFNRVLEQPLYYLESVRKFDKDLSEYQLIYLRYNFIYGKINEAKDKFKRNIFEFQNDILNYLRNEPRKAETLLKEVILATEKILVRIGSISQDYSFKYTDSPLLVVYMDFIKDMQCYLKFLNRNGELPHINKYLEKSEGIKKVFEIEMLPKQISVSDEKVKKIITLPEMFKNSDLLDKICDKLIEENIVFRNSEKKLIWQGHQHKTRGKGLQLVALSMCCKKFYNKAYSYKEIHKAYTAHLNYNLSDTNFKDSQLFEAEKYMYMFSAITSI